MADPGEDPLVLEALYSGLERLKVEQGIDDSGDLNGMSVITMAHEVADRFGYDRDATEDLIGTVPFPPFRVECGNCGRWGSSDEALTSGMSHEKHDWGQVSTGPSGWKSRLARETDATTGDLRISLSIRCPDCDFE